MKKNEHTASENQKHVFFSNKSQSYAHANGGKHAYSKTLEDQKIAKKGTSSESNEEKVLKLKEARRNQLHFFLDICRVGFNKTLDIFLAQTVFAAFEIRA